MELDKRIINGKRPLTCFDIEEAEKYIGKLCYMCDEYNLFYQLNLIEPAILMGVEDCETPFHNGQDKQAEFCLPCEWITKEKKFRPYTLKEFFNKFTVGQPIRYRRKSDLLERYLILEGYVDSKGDKEVRYQYIHIGSTPYTLDELFNKYEWQEHYTEDFKPFGVEE
jgi:hypothetical protein